MQTLMHEFEPRHACPTSITANGHARETLRRYPSSCSRGGATPTAVMLPMQLHRTPTETYRTIPSCWSRKFQQDGKIGPLQTVVGGPRRPTPAIHEESGIPWKPNNRHATEATGQTSRSESCVGLTAQRTPARKGPRPGIECL
ncbi:hypothetical protein CSUB01_00195 [Colletotrichum sublineola]|uniref:Uncharacterized protein n=1 Tax=Colletotrichum sublineola TaxID=1173701 RepID=A0A066XBK6_COLSU|nr:hypothetical protein CSUB01_00195 [Colletotrichum sublineola]